MRHLVVLAALSLPCVALCQTPAPTTPASHPPAAAAAAAAAAGKVYCSIQAPPAPGEALNALVSGNMGRAETLYAALVASSQSPAAYAGLVRVQLAGNELSSALSTAKSALAAKPTSAEVQALTGDVLLRSGLIPEAAAAYSRALSLASSRPATPRLSSPISPHSPKPTPSRRSMRSSPTSRSSRQIA
jgi:tetratricopeptide (TPR) repeat protein